MTGELRAREDEGNHGHWCTVCGNFMSECLTEEDVVQCEGDYPCIGCRERALEEYESVELMLATGG